MFEGWVTSNETKAAIESERNQINMQRELGTLQAASNNEATFVREQNERADLIRWQQELENSLEILKHRLRSETKNTEGAWVANGNVEALMTEEGITMVETELSPFLGEEAKNLINSNLTEAMILGTLKNTADTIVCNLADNYDTFVVIATPSKLSHIMRIIKNAMLPTPFRAQDGWTLKENNKGTKRIETFVDNPNQQNKKMWGLLG